MPGDFAQPPEPMPTDPYLSPAQVVVGDLSFTDSDGAYQEEDASPDDAVTADYKIRGRYERDRHVYMMPMTKTTDAPTTSGAGTASITNATPVDGSQGGGTATLVGTPQASTPTCAFVQLSNPTLLWVVDWTACRIGAQPSYPDSTPGDSKWVLLDEHIEPFSVALGTDGKSPVYRLSGTYVYGCRNPSADVMNDVRFGKPPWIAPGKVSQTVDTAKKKTDIL